MSDIWTEFSNVVKTRVLARDDFTGEFYTDIVPSDTSLPYAVITESDIKNWMTYSNLIAGEDIYFRVVLTNDVRHGGVTTLKILTEEIVKALHLKEYSGTNFEIESSKRVAWSKPFTIKDNELQWKQYVDFQVRIRYKSGSDYYTDFQI